MPKKLSAVYQSLKEMNLKRQSNTDGKSHQVWQDDKGREVQLAPKGDRVPDLYVHILSGQLETQGICPRRVFKRRLREI